MIDAQDLQANTEAVAALEKRMQVVQTIMDEVANELGWLTRNLQDLLQARDGVARSPETVHCMECDAEPVPSLSEALRQRWTGLILHDGHCLGMCPGCAKQDEQDTPEIEQSPAKAKTPQPKSQTIVVDAEQFARAMESVEQLSYCCEAPDLQWEGEPETPGIQCHHCGHIVAEAGEIVDYREPTDVKMQEPLRRRRRHWPIRHQWPLSANCFDLFSCDDSSGGGVRRGN